MEGKCLPFLCVCMGHVKGCAAKKRKTIVTSYLLDRTLPCFAGIQPSVSRAARRLVSSRRMAGTAGMHPRFPDSIRTLSHAPSLRRLGRIDNVMRLHAIPPWSYTQVRTERYQGSEMISESGLFSRFADGGFTSFLQELRSQSYSCLCCTRHRLTERARRRECHATAWHPSVFLEEFCT